MERPSPPEAFSEAANRLAEAGSSLLALPCLAGEYADLFLESTIRTRAWLIASGRGPAGWSLTRWHDGGLGVRVERGGAQGIGSTTGWMPTDWIGAASRAEAALRAPSEGRGREDEPPDRSLLPSDALDVVVESDLRALLEGYADAAFAMEDRTQEVRLEFRGVRRRTALANRETGTRRQEAVSVEIRLTVTIRGVASPGISVRGSGAGLTPLYLEGVEQPVREALHAARCAAEARPHPPGRYPAVVAGGWGGVLLHEAVGHALEADVAGAWTERRLGDRVAPEAVTLVDDPTAPGRRGSASFDDEGTPTAERPLVAGGCLTGRLSDRRTVLAGGPAPAGNGRRQDFRHPPLPRMSNLCLRPGGESLDTLLSSVDDGLYIRRLGGGRYDPAAGTFRVAWAEAFRIERGKPTYPLAAGALVGNTRDFLMGIEGIGGEVEWDAGHGHCEKRGQVVPIGTAMPSIRIASIVVVPVEQGP